MKQLLLLLIFVIMFITNGNTQSSLSVILSPSAATVTTDVFPSLTITTQGDVMQSSPTILSSISISPAQSISTSSGISSSSGRGSSSIGRSSSGSIGSSSSDIGSSSSGIGSSSSGIGSSSRGSGSGSSGIGTSSSSSSSIGSSSSSSSSIGSGRSSSSSSSEVTSTPTPRTNNDDNNFFLTQIKFIYIIAGVIMFLILIIIVLLLIVGILCTRKTKSKTKVKKKNIPRTTPHSPRTTPHSPGPSQQSTVVSPTITTPSTSITSPKRKIDNTKSGSPRHKKSQETMSDFPLLCRVLQEYDSPQHSTQTEQEQQSTVNDLETSITSTNSYHIRVPSGASSDLEASVRTATSYISQGSNDYDELESIISVLKTERTSPPRSPPKTLPKPSRIRRKEPLRSVEEENSPELVDADGYHKINIINDEGIKRSQSAQDMFDDPKYPKLIVPSPNLLTNQSNGSQNSGMFFHATSHPSNSNSLSIKRSLTVSDMDSTAFDKKVYKDYMSLQQVLDLVNTKMSPSRETSVEIDQLKGNEELYCPRLLRPVAIDIA